MTKKNAVYMMQLRNPMGYEAQDLDICMCVNKLWLNLQLVSLMSAGYKCEELMEWNLGNPL